METAAGSNTCRASQKRDSEWFRAYPTCRGDMHLENYLYGAFVGISDRRRDMGSARVITADGRQMPAGSAKLVIGRRGAGFARPVRRFANVAPFANRTGRRVSNFSPPASGFSYCPARDLSRMALKALPSR